MSLANSGSRPPPGHGQIPTTGAQFPAMTPVNRLAIASLTAAFVPVFSTALLIIIAGSYMYAAAIMALAAVLAIFIGTVCAIVMGHRARAQIRRTGERGAGLAAAGLVLGYFSVVLIPGSLFFLVLYTWAGVAHSIG